MCYTLNTWDTVLDDQSSVTYLASIQILLHAAYILERFKEYVSEPSQFQ